MNDMTVYQLTRQIQYVVRGFSWPTVWGGGPARGSGQPLFQSEAVVITSMPAEMVLVDRISLPCCLIRPASTRGNEQLPQLQDEARWVVTVISTNQVAPRGGEGLEGGLRDEIGKSQGRGVDEFFAQLASALMVFGLQARPRNSSAPVPIILPDSQVVVARDLELVSRRIPSGRPGFAEGSRLLAAGSPATLTWSNPPDRYDLAQLIINRLAGATPPTTPTAGTVVKTSTGTSSTLPTTFTDSVGAGWAWAVWWGYDEGGITPPDYTYSNPLTAVL